MRSFHIELSSKTLLEKHLRRILNHNAFGRDLCVTPTRTVGSYAIAAHSERLVSELSSQIRQQSYRPYPVSVMKVLLDKERWLFKYTVADRIVHGAAAEILARHLEKLWPEQLYSYRVKRSARVAMLALQHHIRRQQRVHAKQAPLFVLRRDVKSYGDSIPTTDTSKLWGDLSLLLTQATGSRDFSEECAAFVKLLLRAPREQADANDAIDFSKKGLPTGSALVPILCNAYLNELDRHQAAVPGSFYARYGDDFVAIHGDGKIAQDAILQMEKIVRERELTFGEKKSFNLFLHPAGGSINRDSFVGASHCEYLGFRFRYDGAVTCSAKHQRRFWTLVDQVIVAAMGFSHALTVPEKARFICENLESCFNDPSDRFSEISRMLDLNDNRGVLKGIDYSLALKVAQAATGKRGAKAFRELSMRELKSFGLPSFEKRRNAHV